MKCINHKLEDATSQCAQCNAFLCEECSKKYTIDDRIICENCAIKINTRHKSNILLNYSLTIPTLFVIFIWHIIPSEGIKAIGFLFALFLVFFLRKEIPMPWFILAWWCFFWVVMLTLYLSWWVFYLIFIYPILHLKDLIQVLKK